MKKNNTKKVNLQKELETLKNKYIIGNKESWVFAEYHIQTIPGLDETEMQVMKNEIKAHLEIN